jgi:hypothetical protein
MVLPHIIKSGNMLLTSATVNVILVWTPNGASLQHHAAQVHLM